nr:pentatricopeptide repeat-containing protein At1g31790-like [Coffea arabica]
MEVKIPHLTPAPQQRILTPPKRIRFPPNKPTFKKIVTVPTSSASNSSIQIHLPLRRPQHKSTQKTEKNSNDCKPSNCSTVSDVLGLLDCLKIPVSLDLYASFIDECTKSGDPLLAIELHNHIKTSCLRPSLSIFNRLLLMYVSCNLIGYARELFDKMTVRSSCTWAVMVAGYFENGDYGEVIDLFLEMQCSERAKVDGDMDDIVASAIVVCVLKACAKTVNMELGKQVHAWVVKMGYGENLVFSGSLMRFYGKAGFLEGSDCVFYQVPNRNKVIWTTKIVNHCYEEQFDEAFDVFKQMGREGVKKNSYTFSSVLKACASMRDGGCCGQQVHANVVKLGLELNEHVQCGLVNMYGKGGLIKDAQKVFKICGNNRSGACWNAMLTGYIQQGLGIEAFRIICDMKAAGLQPQESLLNELLMQDSVDSSDFSNFHE